MPRWPETGAALAAAACAFAFACAVAVADEGGESSEVSPRPDFAANHLLGDWAGARTALWELGLDPQVLLIVDPYGNPVGGKSQGFTTYSMLSVDLGVDAERLMGLAGGEFDVGFSFNFGEQLSQDWVGNVFPIQSSDVAPDGPRLTNLSWTQSFLDDRISVRAGRFSIDALYGEEFAGSEYFRSFTSVAFNAIPFALFYNAPGAFGYPATTWGARVRIDPTDDFYVMGGVYDGNPDAALADEHGLDFSFEGPTLAIGEIGFRFNQRPGDEGLPGNLKFGSYVLGGDVPAYGTGEPTSGRYGFYLVGDQSIVRFGEAEENRHLGVFGSLVVAPDEEASPMTWFFDAGLVAYGPIASRPKDFLSLGVAYGSFSTDLRESQELERLLDPSIDPQLFEMTIEASYGIHMAPGFTLQPGVQVIVNPGGSPDTPTAIAAGVNAVISF